MTRVAGAAGSYELGARISQRDAVSVYLAGTHGAGPGADQVVVKVATRPSGSSAIKQELHALSALQTPGHVGLVRLVDAGTCALGDWLAVGWCGERTLLDLIELERGRVVERNPRSALEVVRALARALAHVHAQGWVHADVNPRNVVLGEAGPTLIDFGSAHWVADSLGPLRDRPTRGTATPGYTAPERLLGRAWDRRADAYSLGCIAFELLVGRSPFQASDIVGLVSQHAHRAAPSVAALVPGIEPRIARLIGAMLAKDPYTRPAHLDDVAVEIERALGRSPGARNQSTLLFESRMFGRTSVWLSLESQIRKTADRGGGFCVIEGAPGSGRTRLLAEAAQAGADAGLEVVDLSLEAVRQSGERSYHAAKRVLDRGTQKLGWLLLADDLTDRAEISALAAEVASQSDRDRVTLLAVLEEGALGALDGEPSGVHAQRVQLEPLSRDAARRMVSDLLGQHADENLQARVWRRGLGNPREMRSAVAALCADGRLGRDDDGHWCLLTDELTISDGAEPLGSGKDILRLRRAASAARREPTPDWHRIAQYWEEALAELYRTARSDRKARRAAVRIGYQLLKLLSRAADHNSVHALSRRLVELAAVEHPLLEARLRRLDALSYRVAGHNADALQQLELGLACLERATTSAQSRVERERILNRLGASWAYYSSHDGPSSLRAAKSIFASVRAVGTAEQRAEALLHAAKAIALSERYRCSPRVVRLERRAVAILARHGASPVAQVSARSNLAFILLLGDREQCREAIEIFEGVSEKARMTKDVTALTRVATYLAVGYRRVGNLEACEAQSRLTLELSQECGQPGYVGVARAGQGWLAFRRGRVAEAKLECQAALAVWQRRRAFDPNRTEEYPFQWQALMPLLALAAADGSLANETALLEDLLHPTQARLAEPLQAELEAAEGDGSTWTPREWDDWGDRVVRLATVHRYL